MKARRVLGQKRKGSLLELFFKGVYFCLLRDRKLSHVSYGLN